MLTLRQSPLLQNTNGQTFHVLSVIEGQVDLRGAGWQQTFNCFETALIPASSGDYQVRPLGQARILKASVEI